jgi:glycogen operon protein
LTLSSVRGRYLHHVIINAYWEPLTFQLPAVPEGSVESWRRCLDTALPSPDDFTPWATAARIGDPHYVVAPRAVVMLALAVDAGWSVRAAEK